MRRQDLWGKALAYAAAFTLAVGALPLTAFAGEVPEEVAAETETEGKAFEEEQPTEEANPVEEEGGEQAEEEGAASEESVPEEGAALEEGVAEEGVPLEESVPEEGILEEASQEEGADRIEEEGTEAFGGTDEARRNDSTDGYGIGISGSYYDWTQEKTVPIGSITQGQGDSQVNSRCAWKLTGDKETILIYLENIVPWGGERSTGNLSITTDLNKTFMFRITDQGAFTGNDYETELESIVENRGFGHGGDVNQWSYEIKVPVSLLPAYKQYVNFGYDAQSFVLTDLDLGKSNIKSSSSDIIIDGDFSEWEYYPVGRLDYTTNGTHHATPDGEASLYSDGERIYGYCISEMTEHQNAYDVAKVTFYNRLPATDDWGGQYFGWNSGDLGVNFWMDDADGNIHECSGELQGITDTHGESIHVYLLDLQGGSGYQNIKDVYDNPWNKNKVYGEMYIKVGGGKAESEYYINAPLYAERYGGTPEDVLKTVAAEYIRIGGYVTSSGTPTGPALGVAMGLGIALTGVAKSKKGRKKEEEENKEEAGK